MPPAGSIAPMSTTDFPLQSAPARGDESIPEAPRERVGLGEALRGHPLTVVVSVVILAVFGAVAGLGRSTTFTATAQVAVEEPTTPNAAQLPGVVQASQEFAANASRLITASAIVDPLAHKAGVASGVVVSDLLATPIPQSSLIKIVAASHSRSFSIALANDAASLFAGYATRQARNPSAVAAVLREFQAASARYREALLAQQRVQAAKRTASPRELVGAAAATEAARLRQQTLSLQYRTAVEANTNAPQVILYLPARSASSNRSSNLEIFLFGGIVAGLLIGVALAVLMANRARVRPVSA